VRHPSEPPRVTELAETKELCIVKHNQGAVKHEWIIVEARGEERQMGANGSAAG
jgi:hypothetical protein